MDEDVCASGVMRLLDANANRAREAMRVMEDTARFVLNDVELTRRGKELRHDFAAAARRLPNLPAARDTPGDVGTPLTTDAERDRRDLAAVAVAAGKRLSESLRCCEEYGKLVDGAFAAAVKQIRYRGYELERALTARLAVASVPQWRVCVIVSENLCDHHGWLDVARWAVEGGADCVQLREKSLADGELLERATRLVEAVAAVAPIDVRDGTGDKAREGEGGGKSGGEGGWGAVIVNDRPDVALLAGATGVHVGEEDLPVAGVRGLLDRFSLAAARPRLLVGASTHDVAEAARAIERGADYCGVGTIFATHTKARKPAGLDYLRAFVRRWPDVPHLAIGGIDADNVAAVAAAGAKGVAVSSAVCRSPDPRRVVRRLAEAMAAPRAAS